MRYSDINNFRVKIYIRDINIKSLEAIRLKFDLEFSKVIVFEDFQKAIGPLLIAHKD
jgi:hypothetical protein